MQAPFDFSGAIPLNAETVQSVPNVYPDDKCLAEGRKLVILQPDFSDAGHVYKFNASSLGTRLSSKSGLLFIYVDNALTGAGQDLDVFFDISQIHYRIAAGTVKILPIFCSLSENLYIKKANTDTTSTIILGNFEPKLAVLGGGVVSGGLV